MRYHGAAGDMAHGIALVPYRAAGPGDALVNDLKCPDAPGQGTDVGLCLVNDRLVSLKLSLQSVFAHVMALERREAHGKAGQGDCKDGDGRALGIASQFVAVKRQAGFEAQGIPCPQADRVGAFCDQGIPG